MRKFLYIEDNRDALDLFVAASGLAGITPATCENGAEGLQILDEQDFDAVILDLSMSVMDGLTLAEQIRINEENKPHKKPACIIFFTARTIDSAILRIAQRCSVKAIYQKGATDINRMLGEISLMCCDDSTTYSAQLNGNGQNGHAKQTILVAFIGILALIMTVTFFLYAMNGQKRDFDNAIHAEQEKWAKDWGAMKSQRDQLKISCDVVLKDKQTLGKWAEMQTVKPPPELLTDVPCSYIESKDKEGE